MSDRLEAAVRELVAALREEMAFAPPIGPRELLSVGSAAERASIGRTLMYSLIQRGDVRSVKAGRRRLIPADSLAEFMTRVSAATNGGRPEVDRRASRSTPPRAA